MSTPNISTSNDRFNTEALAWDSNPEVRRTSSLALESILGHFPQLQNTRTTKSKGLDVLEIGCGTGLLSFMVAPHVRSLTAVDTSEGMIEAFKTKLWAQNDIQNVLPICVLLMDPDDPLIRPDPLYKDENGAIGKTLPPRRFDLIISHLVLHHIPSLEDIFATMYCCLKLGGSVALTDFEDFGPEARKFHPESKMDGVERHGIHREIIRNLLKDAGFVNIKIETAFEMEKEVETTPGEAAVNGQTRSRMTFPFLICTATKE